MTEALLPSPADTGTDAPAPAVRRGRPSLAQSEAITQAILAAAGEMFITDGYDATAMEAIAARVGIPKTTLYKRFTDKGALLDAVLHDRVSQWSQRAQKQHGPRSGNLRQRLLRHIVAMMVWGTDPEVRAVMRLAASAYGLSGRNVGRQGFFAYDRMADSIAASIRELAPAHGITPEQPDLVARMCMALVLGWLEERDYAPGGTEGEMTVIAERMVDVLIKGTAAW